MILIKVEIRNKNNSYILYLFLLSMMSVLGARARARARQNRSAQGSFFQGARAPSTYRALSHNFSGFEVFIQKCLYF
jgi:hypothetical protein